MFIERAVRREVRSVRLGSKGWREGAKKEEKAWETPYVAFSLAISPCAPTERRAANFMKKAGD